MSGGLTGKPNKPTTSKPGSSGPPSKPPKKRARRPVRRTT